MTPEHPQSVARRRTRLTLSLSTVAAMVVLAACGSDRDADPAARAAATIPVAGGTIEFGAQQEPECVNGANVEQAYLVRQVLDSLVARTPDGTSVPWLATSWKPSNDHRSWTFELRDDVTFSDGTPFNAEAVKANFAYWLDPETLHGSVSSYVGEYFKRAVVVDDHTVRIDLKQPYSPLLTVLGEPFFGINSPTSLKRSAAEICAEPVGSGPFTVAEWDRGQRILFRKNPDYDWAPENAEHQGPAHVDAINWKFLKEPAVRYGSLEQGSSQVVYDIPALKWASAEKRYEVERFETPGRPFGITFNASRAPFDDVRVRQAFGYAVDRQKAVESVFRGLVEYEGNGAIGRTTPGYVVRFADAYTPDAAKANELLDAAGWTARDADGTRTKGGEPLRAELVYGAGTIVNTEGGRVLQALQEQARQVGFEIELKPLPPTEVGQLYSGPDVYDLTATYATSSTAGVMPNLWRRELAGKPNPYNAAWYYDDELIGALEGAIAATSEADQNAGYADAQKIISEDALALGLYAKPMSLAWDGSKISGIRIDPAQGSPVFYDAQLQR